MSEESLNASIAAKWESAGLDASEDGYGTTDIVPESDVADVSDSDDATNLDTVTTTEEADDEAGLPDTTTEVEPPVIDTAAALEAEKNTETTDEKADKGAAATEDALAEALGLGKPPADPKKRAAWWKSRVPYSQIHKAVTEREKKLTDTHTVAVKGYTDKITQYDTRFGDVAKVENIITNNPDQYVKTLAALFPDTYGKLFASLPGLAAATAPVEPKLEDPGPQPDFDLKLPDGSMTYGVEGYQKLLAWQEKVQEQKMLARLKPHLDFVKTQEAAAKTKLQADQAAEIQRKGIQSANDAIAEAETWDLGKENIVEIVAEAKKLPEHYSAELALNIAYRKVVGPKLKANRDEMQAKILKDMKKTSAKQTAAGLQSQSKTTTVKASESSTDLDTRIKAAWQRQGLI